MSEPTPVPPRGTPLTRAYLQAERTKLVQGLAQLRATVIATEGALQMLDRLLATLPPDQEVTP